jgi:hypothetical protein
MERLSAQDLATLWWDDFGWPGDIGALAILDGTGSADRDGSFRIESVRRAIEPRLGLPPRFRQVLYRPALGLGGRLRHGGLPQLTGQRAQRGPFRHEQAVRRRHSAVWRSNGHRAGGVTAATSMARPNPVP